MKASYCTGRVSRCEHKAATGGRVRADVEAWDGVTPNREQRKESCDAPSSGLRPPSAGGRRTWATLVVLFLLTSIAQAAETKAAARPNIVLVFADDLGINDIACYGRKEHRTPNLDRLASQGMQFECAYTAQPICSPSRAAIMTGKCPARLNLTNFLPGRADANSQRLLQPVIEGQLPLEEVTIAEVLREAGYATGLFGKWHLGGKGFEPTQQGFDTAVITQATTKPTPETGGKGEFIIEAAVEKFIEENRDRPFFCYVPHNCPHVPLSAIEEKVAKYPGAFNPEYAAMIETLDDAVGRLMAKVESLGIADRTIFIFTSDNGGLHVLESRGTPATRNDPYRAGKGYLYEGGLREPLIVRWPGVVKAGSKCESPVVLTDLVPTLIEAAGVDVAKTVGPLDGVSLSDTLRGKPQPERTLYWHFPNYTNQGGRPAGAMREGNWKLIEQFEDESLELYDLSRDIGEKDDLAQSNLALAHELRDKLSAWRTRVGARMPTQNPDYDASAHDHVYVEHDPSTLTAKATADATSPEWESWDEAMRAAVKGRAKHVTPATGDIRLHAKDATIHGDTLRYEPQSNKNVLGYWKNVDDWAEWDFEVAAAGTYVLEVQYGCGKGCAGGDVFVDVAGQAHDFTVQETGHFQQMILHEVGEVELPVGKLNLQIRPQSKPGPAVMDVRLVVLRPKG